ncbi:MAG: hypothetical protein ACR2FO_00200 [Actinomycetota bacterium]
MNEDDKGPTENPPAGTPPVQSPPAETEVPPFDPDYELIGYLERGLKSPSLADKSRRKS